MVYGSDVLVTSTVSTIAMVFGSNVLVSSTVCFITIVLKYR